MWSKDRKHLQPAAYSRRSSKYVDRDFQLRYTKYILTVAVVSCAVFLFPVFYFSNQNYQLFFDLADLMNPKLSQYIARERIGFNVFFIISFACSLLFWTVLSRKMTAKIAGPAKILRNHIRLFSRGDFSMTPVRVRDDDEFKDLINAYNYLYTLLKVQSERELQSLKKIQGAVTNPLARELILDMIHDRESRLSGRSNAPEIDTPTSLNALNVASPAGSPDSRHAS